MGASRSVWHVGRVKRYFIGSQMQPAEMERNAWGSKSKTLRPAILALFSVQFVPCCGTNQSEVGCVMETQTLRPLTLHDASNVKKTLRC